MFTGKTGDHSWTEIIWETEKAAEFNVSEQIVIAENGSN